MQKTKAILCDTRQQAGKHNTKENFFEDAGIATCRTKIPFGDYCLPPSVSVDTKRNIYELAQNIQHEHKRFRAELEKAQSMGCVLIVLVENEDGVTDLETLAAWRESLKHYNMRKAKSGNMYARRVEGMTLAKACATMQRKYDVQFLFCSPDQAGPKILELLGEGVNG